MRNFLFGLAAAIGLICYGVGDANADDGAIRLLGTQPSANIVVGTDNADVQATPVRYGYYRGYYRPWGGYYRPYYRPYGSYYRGYGYGYGYRPYGSYYRGYYGYRPWGYWR